jgi:serine/threonine protein phosphatase 1
MKREGKLLTLPEIEGKTFICGDLHGCYFDFMRLLAIVGFNEEKDRVICCGDLIDRGTDSLMCVTLLEEPWFFTVLGNHEEFLVDTCYQRIEPNYTAKDHLWIRNGGMWAYSLSPQEAIDIAEKMCRLPVGIEAIVNGETIAIIHADPLHYNWTTTKDALRGMPENHMKELTPTQENIIQTAIWSRGQVDEDKYVDGCHLMVHGHTIVDEPRFLSNRLFLDTGSFLKYWDGENGHISILCVNTREITGER